MPVISVPFGNTPDGRAADLFILRNAHGLQLECTNLGGIVTRILTPDRDGHFANVTLGYPTLLDYFKKSNYFGALVGRVGNRIRHGKFTLDGQALEVARNANGKHHLHGGVTGFNRRLWTATPADDGSAAVTFRYRSPDGEENYPGNLDVAVTYTLTDDNTWAIDYHAVTDAPTPVNLTQHAYFNLNGAQRDVLAHELRLNASRYTPPDDDLVVTGEIVPVSGTPFDFTTAKPIGRDMDQLPIDGYDHNYLLDRDGHPDNECLPFADVFDPDSGRTLAVATTEPAVQLYTGNAIEPDTGCNGIHYQAHSGFCLEAQHTPDSVNLPAFPDIILRPGQTYRQTTRYQFGVRS